MAPSYDFLFCAIVRLFIIILRGRWAATVYLSGGWIHNNVKFVSKDEDIQVNIIRMLVGGYNPFNRTKLGDGCRGFFNCILSLFILALWSVTLRLHTEIGSTLGPIKYSSVQVSWENSIAEKWAETDWAEHQEAWKRTQQTFQGTKHGSNRKKSTEGRDICPKGCQRQSVKRIFITFKKAGERLRKDLRRMLKETEPKRK